jgi:signal transduction histidine kinase
VANAIRYHDKNKSEKFVQVQVEKTQKEVTIHVVDNGQGIHPDHKEKIFNMFYKASPYSNGSGLGLYIAKETIAKLGGDISVSSELGKGSTFSIILPA